MDLSPFLYAVAVVVFIAVDRMIFETEMEDFRTGTLREHQRTRNRP